jgi:hypothetical protein
MFKKGDRVIYRGMEGEIIDLTGDLLIVLIPGKGEYPLLQSQVMRVSSIPRASVVADITIELTKSTIKNIDVINSLAVMSAESGISELHIFEGKVITFKAVESLDEKIARYKREAVAKAESEAEKKAREEFAKSAS